MKKSLMIFVAIVWVLGQSSAWAMTDIIRSQDGGDYIGAPGQPPVVLGIPADSLFPNHDTNYAIINLTNNLYGDNQPFPNGYYSKYASFNSDGTRIVVSARNQVGGVSQIYEIWVMDYDPITQTISNFQQITNNGGTGDIAWNNQPSWSLSDPDLLLYLEVHMTTPNIVKTYDMGTSLFNTVYDPTLDSNGDDVTNPAFRSTFNDQVIFGSSYGSGNDRILLFNGTYPSIQVSSNDQNLDPSSNYVGSKITYYSTNAHYSAGSIFSEYYGGSWNEDTLGFGDPSTGDVPGFWSFYNGKVDDMILSLRSDLGWSATGLGLYTSSGNFVSDLLGDGGTDFQWAYGNHNWKGPNKEILFRSEEFSHAGYGNNIFIALGLRSDTVWVDGDWDGQYNAGGHAWGYDAFNSIQDGITAVAVDGIVNVHNGTYIEGPQIVIDKNVSIIGENKDLTIITPSANTGSSGDSRGWFLVPAGFNLNLSNVTLDGAGYQIYQAIRAFGTGTLDNNIFQNIIYSSYIGFVLAHLDNWNIVNNTFSNIGRVGVLSFGNGVTSSNITGNIYTGKGNGDWLDYAFEAGAGAVVALSNNTISNCTGIALSDSSTSAGILATTYFGTGTDVTISNNDIFGSSTGIFIGYDSLDESAGLINGGNLIHDNGNGVATSSSPNINLAINENAIYDNTSWGIDAAGGPVVDAESNWWGDGSGPGDGALLMGIGGFSAAQPSDFNGENQIKNNSSPDNLIASYSSNNADRKGTDPGAPVILSGTGDNVSPEVDYSPWWGADYVNDPHTSPWHWYVDTVQNSTIQEGVNIAVAGDSLTITSGVYIEQVHITTNNLFIEGISIDSTFIQSPVSLTDYFVTGTNNNYPVVFIDGVDNASISNLTVDGDNQGDSNYRFNGIAFWNSGGTVSEVDVLNVMNSTFSGAQHGVGIYSNNDGLGGPYSITLFKIFVDDFQKTAIALSGDSLSVNLDSVSVIGEGPTGVTAQNGIQVGFGAGGTVTDCSVTGIGYTGPSWVASGMLFLNGSDVTVDGICNISNSQANIIFQETNGSVTGAVITTSGIASEEGISIRDYGSVTMANSDKSPLDISPIEEVWKPGANGAITTLNTTVSINNVELTGVNEPGSYGIAAWALGNDVIVDIQNSDIQNWEIGIVAYESGSIASVTANANSLGGNDLNIWSNVVAAMDAEDNYWGTINCPIVASLIDGNVDFEPWCNFDFSYCSFSCAITDVWVDDDFTGPGNAGGHYWGYDAFDNIQDGVNAVSSGGGVHVAAGAYEEQVVISKQLAMLGSGVDITVIQSPDTLTEYFTTSGDNYPIVYIHDITGVVIENLTIDGLGRGNGNVRFIGVGYWNSGGDLTDVRLTGVRETPFSGAQHGVSVYSYNNTGGPYTINLTDVDVDDMQKNAFALSGSGLTANLENCTAVGAGPTGVTAQNGIQIGTGAAGSIIGCEVSGMDYTGPSWSASGILLYYPDPGMVMSGNNVHDCQGALNAYFADSLLIDSCQFNQNGFEYIWGGDGIEVTNNGFTNNSGEALYIADATNLSASGNLFDSNATSIVVDGLADGVIFSGNDLINSAFAGVAVQPYLTDEPINVVFSGNNISGNAFGISNTTVNMVGAISNWWGDATGPDTGTAVLLSVFPERPANAGLLLDGQQDRMTATADRNGTVTLKTSAKRKIKGVESIALVGSGDKVSTLVDYSPWWGADYVNDPHTSAWQWYLDNSNYSNIQEGVIAVSSGDTLFVLPDTYSGIGNRDIDFSGKELELLSLAGADSTIIDCEELGRAFHFHSGETNSAAINGFTIVNGSVAGYGGAVLCENSSSPKFEFCLFLNNHSDFNGGVFHIEGSDPVLVNNTIVFNSAGGYGGALSIENGSPEAINCIMYDDTSSSSNEIYVNGGSPLITFSNILGGWTGAENIDCNPRFCDPDSGNFYISDISCCLNAGFGGISIGAFPLGCTGDFLPGDVNADGSVNGLDVIYLVGYLKDQVGPIPDPILRADANGSCNVNGLDVIYLVNYFKGGPAPIRGDCFGLISGQEQFEHNIIESTIKTPKAQKKM